MRINGTSDGGSHDAVFATSDPALATAMLVVRGDAAARDAEGRVERDARERAHAAFDRAIEAMGAQADHMLAGALVAGSLAVVGGAASVGGALASSSTSTGVPGQTSGKCEPRSIAWSRVAESSGASVSRVGEALSRVVGEVRAQRDQLDSSRERQGADEAKSLASGARDRSNELERDAQSAREVADAVLRSRSSAIRAALGRA